MSYDTETTDLDRHERARYDRNLNQHKEISDLQRDSVGIQRNTLEIHKKGQEQQKQAAQAAAKAAAIQTVELKKLNQTNANIEALNAELVQIQSSALEESNRQTKLLEAQLHITRIAELERNRQVELKQAAYAINESLLDILKMSSPEQQFAHLWMQKVQIELVGLSPSNAVEIADKNYIKDVMERVESSIKMMIQKIDPKFIRENEIFFSKKETISSLDYEAAMLRESLGNYEVMQRPSKGKWLIKGLIHPAGIAMKEVKKSPENKFQKKGLDFIYSSTILLYYILVISTYGFGLLGGLYVGFNGFKKASKSYELTQEEIKSIEKKINDIDRERQNLSQDISGFESRYLTV